jgi:hypothetical protein
MKGKNILIHPLNDVYLVDPSLPPRFTQEFQNELSPGSPLTAFPYSSINLSSRGIKAGSHH